MELNNESFQQLVEQASDAVLLLDADGIVVYANAATAELFGRQPEELLGESFGHVTTAEQPTEIQIPYRQGGVVTADIRSRRVMLAGRPFDAVYLRDVTERKLNELALLRTNRALRVLGAGNSELIHAETEAGLLEAICRVCVDEGGYRMTWVGFAEQDEAKSVRPVAHAGFEDGYLESTSMTWGDDDHGKGPIGRAIRTGEPQVNHSFATDSSVAPWRDEALRRGYHSSVALPLKDTSGPVGVLTIYAGEADGFDDAELAVLKDLADDLTFGIATLRDRAKHKIAKERIEYLAYFDELTGLANRNQLMEALTEAITRLGAGQQPALLTLNVTRFGDIQTGIGIRQAGELLRQVASRIRDALDASELATRIGGDEFAILLSNGGIDRARDCAQRVEQALDAPFQQAGIPISIQMRIGAVLVPDYGDDPETLLLCSNMAVRQARRSGTTFEVYGGPTESQSPRHLALIADLRLAIEANQLLLDYQPKVDMLTGKVVGVEALVRWSHPEHGLLPPARFIDVAEQTGLINPLTYWVLDAALLQCAQWREAGFDMPVAVNISVNNFRDADFVNRVGEMLRHRNVPAKYLELEITESTLMEEPAKAFDVLDQLQTIGIDIFIDDFGTGFSSLNYVANLPIHALKIDRSFVIRMLDSPRTRSVIAATVSLARSLGMRTVAEGVDAKEQAEALVAMGCSEIQGFYFSRPVEAQALRRWTKEFSLASYALRPTLEHSPHPKQVSTLTSSGAQR